MVVKSPGLLKRTRVRDDLNDSFGGSRKRIRLCEQDSTGADIDPQANDEELVKILNRVRKMLIILLLL